MMDWAIFQLVWQAVSTWAIDGYFGGMVFFAEYWPGVLMFFIGMTLSLYGWKRSGQKAEQQFEQEMREIQSEIAEMRAMFAPEPRTGPLVQEQPCKALVEARAVVRERWDAPRESEE